MGLEKRIRSIIGLFFLLHSFLMISCKQSKKYHDTEVQSINIVGEGVFNTQAERDSILKSVLDFQEELNASFKDPEESPLVDKDKMNFESLDYFLPNADYVIRAKLIRTPNALPFGMPTTTDRISHERVYGRLQFNLKGKPFSLEVYQSLDLLEKEGYEDYLFLPFTDLTNGNETYGGGRYLDLRTVQGDSIWIDFNKSYNPYCAYNKKYSCPVVPSKNHLEIDVQAGVKAFIK
ncbi:DUF1684 domain-containing protein [Flavobacteriaceae bacterium]|nr:DUF1684 domain-containing protein [Flavobacteriaceae bacterium]